MLKYFFISVLVLGAIIALSTLYADRSEVFSEKIEALKPSVQIGSAKFFVELAKTDAEKQKGLSGRESLASDHGMLFVYEKAGAYSFWMPDMRFPIDIVWINNGKVVDLDENVSNEFDPANPKIYSPSNPVKYVLEINAGAAAVNNIKIGDAVVFENIE